MATKQSYTLQLLTYDGSAKAYPFAVATQDEAERRAAGLLHDGRYAAVKIMAQHIHVAARTAMWME